MGKEMVSGARIVLECLKRESVTDIFGYPGGAVIPIYDELYKTDDEINHYLARHEQGAAHEADGYARATGKVGVCIATSGPGATNLVTGIMTAKMDSIPLVAITGQVGRSLFGRDSFQEADIVSITIPITKTNYQVMSIEELPGVMKEAFHIARSGRPGPVLIDIPKDIQLESIEYDKFEELYSQAIVDLTEDSSNIDMEMVMKAKNMIENAKKPLIVTGAGTIHSNASEVLKELAKKCDIPVVATLLGLGSFPADDDLFIGMLGMHGQAASNFAVKEADLIIAAGFRFDDRITGKIDEFCPNTPIIHIDIDPSEIEKNVKVAVPIVGDLKEVLEKIVKKIDKKRENNDWIERIRNWKQEYCLQVPKNYDKKLPPQFVINEIGKHLKGDEILVTDVGQHQMWTAQYTKIRKPRTFITSGGAGTMGYGLPAAIGAKVAKPDKKVVLISGDGGFQMNIQELMLIKEYKLPIKIFIINNAYLGMVRQWQELFNDKRYSYVNLDYNPDFNKVAEAYGIRTERLANLEDLDKLEEIINSDEAILVNCIVAREENVFPMIPAGKSIDQMIGLRGVKDDE